MVLRSLSRSPAFTTTVILTLALGIGAGTAVFSATDHLLLRTLPYPDPDRIAALDGPVSLPNLLDWRAQGTSFDGVAGFRTRTFGMGRPFTVINVGMVTSDLFSVLGSGAHLGRTFTEAEESQGAAVIVLSDGLRPRPAIGSTITLNDEPYVVIGILPPDFIYPVRDVKVDAYIPISHRDYGAREGRPLGAVARLKPGVSLAAAREELRGINARLAAAYPRENARAAANLESLDDAWKGSLRQPLLLLIGAALLLLGIVCTNVVNLILARSLARAREMAIRTALGAHLADIARLLLTEALLLCIGGAASGIVVGTAIVRAIPLLLHTTPLSLDTRAVVFAATVALGLTLLCGLAPALATRRRVFPFRLRQGLIIGQVALSLLLLLSAGAFLRVFVKLVNRNPGFDSSHVAYFGFGLPEARYDVRQMAEFHRQLRQRLESIPGVEAAGAVMRLPLNDRPAGTTFQVEGAGLPVNEWSWAAFNIVDPAYFSVMRIPLLAGRRFDWETDRIGHPLAIVVNRAFEKAYGQGKSLIGKRIQVRFWTDLTPPNALWQVVGVAGDIYQAGLDQTIRPQIYFPVSQTGLDGGHYVVRTSRQDASIPADLEAAYTSLDPNLERIRVGRLDTWVRDSLGARRLPAILTGLFATVGLALTLLGLYGVLALEMGQRRKEMAIRQAVGATHASIAALVLRRGLLLTLAGTAFGALAFTFVSRAIESQLYEVSPADPLNAAVVLVILFGCAALACLRPAWDALRAAPITVLREM